MRNHTRCRLLFHGAIGCLAIVVLSQQTSAFAAEQAIPIGSHRQLFLDDWVVSQTSNVQRRQGMVTKNPNNPILVRDKAWETQRVDLYGSAVFDPATNKLQIFYSTMSLSTPVKHDDMLAYAVSDDMGATWTKPDLGLIPFNGDRHTNLVLKAAANDFSGIVHGPCVFLDAHESDPTKRYKVFLNEYYNGCSFDRVGHFHYSTGASVGKAGMYVAYSPDGIHWTRPSAKPFSGLHSDTTQSAFWDARLGKYVAYVRGWTSNGRSVFRMESDNFETWTEPTIVLEGTSSQQIYSMGVTPYEGIYLGTSWIFDATVTSSQPSKPEIWPELAVSRDGVQWSRPFPGQQFIPTGSEGTRDSKQIRMSSSLVVLDDKILLVYGQSADPHHINMRAEIGMATMRLDGFASLDAADAEGSLLTKPLRWDVGALHVNAIARPGGYVKAEIQDAVGKPLAGYELDACQALTGDQLNGRIAWEKEAMVPATSSVGCRIRFLLKDAKLFSFWVAESKGRH